MPITFFGAHLQYCMGILLNVKTTISAMYKCRNGSIVVAH